MQQAVGARQVFEPEAGLAVFLLRPLDAVGDFGLRIKANTESLGQGTTGSVVTAITVVILADAVFAIVFNGVGYY